MKLISAASVLRIVVIIVIVFGGFALYVWYTFRPEPLSPERQLIEAAEAGDLDRIRRLVGRGIEIETDASTTRTDASGRTPFMAAVAAGQRDAAQLLLDLGADPHARRLSGETAMHSAVLGGEPEMIMWLVTLGLDVNQDSDFGPPLMHACTMFGRFGASGDKIAAIRALIDAGADVNKPDSGGITPLIGAALHLRDDLIPMLVEAGADVTLADRHGRTALYAGTANAYGTLKPATIRLLLDHGADLEARDADGRTALLKAAAWGLPRQVGILLEIGADATARDKSDKGAIDLANERDGFPDSDFDAVLLLLQNASSSGNSD